MSKYHEDALMSSFAIPEPRTSSETLPAHVAGRAPQSASPMAVGAGERRTANLAPWLNEPVVQDAVAGVLMRADQPMLLCEAAAACDLPLWTANRVLGRLCRKGVATRYKLPMQRHAYCHRRKTCIPGGATRMLFVYSWLSAPSAKSP